jgi:hypothetical protein
MRTAASGTLAGPDEKEMEMSIRTRCLRALSLTLLVVPFILAACSKGGTPGY